MMNSFNDMQKLGQSSMEQSMKLMGEWNKGWQTLASDWADYSKRSFEDGTATFEKLIHAKSLEQVFEIQTSYYKRAYDEYMHQMNKVGAFYSSMAKDSYKPLEKMIQPAR
ncbi:MAG: phasin family protein [Hyphomicrobium sp.]|nr:phasin family protein [Hyphomicrobium sp.]